MIDWWRLGSANAQFNVNKDDFSSLEIRAGVKNPAWHYFYDKSRNHVINDFVLDDSPQVETRCQVTLIKLDGHFSPRLRIWKHDKTKLRQDKKILAPNTEETKTVKAIVDIAGCHEGFWKLINFLQTFTGIQLPDNKFRILMGDETNLVDILRGKDKIAILSAVKKALGTKLTESDILNLADRQTQLTYFEKLLGDKDFFAQEKERLGLTGNESVWQSFFEKNVWIFGYGLKLVSCDSFDDKKLERITTGANVFQGAGKRADGLLRTRGYISSLLFCEIKTDETNLLEPRQYRPPDVYQASHEVVGGVAQVQKTAHKALRTIASEFHRLYEPDGTPLRVEVSAIRPHQVLVVGNLKQLSENGDLNLEKSLSFEFYRKSINDVEIITFDELYERAKYIVRDSYEDCAN